MYATLKLMKRLLLLTILILGVILLNPQKINAAGEQCRALGGTCSVDCVSSSDSIGKEDCPVVSAGKFGNVPQVCCIPKCSSGNFCVTAPDPFFCSEKREGTWKPCAMDGGLGNCCVPNPDIPPGVDCPSPQMQCGDIYAKGGCKSPCKLYMTSGGGRGPSWCTCLVNTNPPGTKACGESCLDHADCGSECAYCRGSGPGKGLSCQPYKTSPSNVKLPVVFCDEGNPPKPIDTPKVGSARIYTAIGCIPVESTNAFIKFLLTWGAGIAGGIALLLIIYGGFLVITSGGSPQKIQAGKELLTAAIMGLVLLLFGTFILQFIGIEILNIPGFGQ
ncbi:MAG: hypothetical protein UT08_C0005G0063 [Candidatus Woesebacteria bacterium GW2011_GWB1_38_8]|uniref:Uncharacterized protein n=1 Tax=Candidatus Woesebacteria bacterium GW2011_GWB1_38_8 TaxID=1618570 RepID=A0A0G0L3P5_9BACT|nr:MAG: hypothetical protein UT08_C0005G0063 [Candidatus Woesebacteria bacterium GW2011_GWB1_38_8]